MWKVLAIAYVAVAILTFVSLMILMCRAVTSTPTEMGEYPEDAGTQLLGLVVVFITATFMALLWPLCPVILIGVVVYEKVEKRWPGICGAEEGEYEPGTDSTRGSGDHICQ